MRPDGWADEQARRSERFWNFLANAVIVAMVAVIIIMAVIAYCPVTP